MIRWAAIPLHSTINRKEKSLCVTKPDWPLIAGGIALFVVVLVVSLVGSFAHAQAPAQEQAVTWTAGDPQLKWGPLPAVLA